MRDSARHDDGALNRWSLALTTAAVGASRFAIEVRFQGGGLSAGQRAAFEGAAGRWSEIIFRPLPITTILRYSGANHHP